MVADVVPGTYIRGALSYNENKVKNERAELLDAVNYPKNAADLSFNEKLRVMTLLADLNSRAEQKCVHISINFHPSEKFTNEQFVTMTKEYMQQIGFGDQPYLIYNHLDAAHPHLHVVTTSIEPDGRQIRLRYIGRDVSGPATRRIEKQFGLVPATAKTVAEPFVLKPIDLEKAEYGKSETKATISNIVRSVFKHYKFTSIYEFNAILEQFNVTAYRGEPGMNMYEKGGLVYFLIDPVGKRVGKPIKASTIYDSPTLKKLQEKFLKNDVERQQYKVWIQDAVDDILSTGVGLEEFMFRMNQRNIQVVLRKSDTGKIYGITYVDNKNFTVFNGSDLGDQYKAKTIQERLNIVSHDHLIKRNKVHAERVLNETNFQRGFKSCLATWGTKGMIVTASEDDNGAIRYHLGLIDLNAKHHWLAPPRMQTYFKVNGFSREHCDYLNDKFRNILVDRSGHVLADFAYSEALKMVENCFEFIPTSDYISKELLQEARKRKRRRRG